LGTFSGDIEKKLYGYVVFIRMYSVWDNQAYNGGVVRVLYGGINKTFLGMSGLNLINPKRVQGVAAKPGRSGLRN